MSASRRLPFRWNSVTAFCHQKSRLAFTIIELLVVILVMGVLMALLLAAVQASREAARAGQCKNNLRQLSLALIQYHNTHKQVPSGGWSYRWLPDPNAVGKDQPGSWIYGILPELEEQLLRQLALTGGTSDRYAQLVRLVETPLVVLNCPSRRPALVYPAHPLPSPDGYVSVPDVVGTSMTTAGRSDYGGSTGGGDPPRSASTHDRGIPVDGAGPNSLQDARNWEKSDPITGLNLWQSRLSGAANGVIIARYPVALRQVVDGASHTYLLGEKFLETEHYDSGYSGNDDQNAYVGFDRDNQVSARFTPLRDTSTSQLNALLEASGEIAGFHFGSAHPAVFHVAMCDGSVHSRTFDLDLAVHRAGGSRDEAELVTAKY